MLQTRYVFVDAQPFVEARFSFHHGRLKRLAELLASNTLVLLMPAVTESELRTQMAEAVAKAVAQLGTAQREATFLAQGVKGVDERLKAIDLTQAKNDMQAVLDQFLTSPGIKKLPTPANAADSVLDSYFRGAPPFGTGKKKHEFPDAIALATLAQWNAESGAACYVVSRDSDLASACTPDGPYRYLESLDQLFGLIDAAASKAAQLLHESAGEVEKQLARAFEYAGFHLSDVDGDVDEVEVVSVTIEETGINRVEGNLALFWVSANIEYRARVSYWDPDTATYDSEDKVLFYHHRIEGVVRDTIEITAYGNFRATEDMTSVRELAVEFDSGEVFEVNPYAAE